MKKQFTLNIKQVLATLAIMNAFAAPAQFTYNYLKAADDYYRKGDYFSAAQYYEKALADKKPAKTDKVDPYVVESIAQQSTVKSTGKPDSRTQILFRTAEAYRQINNYVKAEPFYQQTAGAPEFPAARYWYAKSLRYNSKFAEAENEFSTFLQDQKQAGALAEDAAKELANLKFIQQELKKDIHLFTVQKLSTDGMTHGADYAPSLQPGGAIVFTSTRPDSAKGKNLYINKLYTVSTPAEMANARKLDIPQEKGVHQAASAFTADGKMVFFTRWTIGNGKKVAAIYMSRNQNGKWSEPVKLDSSINREGYSSQQPSIDKKGNLYFSSDKPGGYGGFDLYVAGISEGSVGNGRNLGPEINTKGDEQAPYLNDATGLFAFATNGRVGMGGFDIHQASFASGKWQQPVNLGYPINSVKDDIYVLSTGSKKLDETMYFSSDRASECCLEMYVVNKKAVKKLVAGVVLDCKTGAPIGGATVTVSGNGAAQLSNQITNARGRYELLLDEYQALKVTAQAEGYPTQSLQVSTPTNLDRDSSFNPDICLTKPEVIKPYEVDKPVILNNIYYDFGKATVRIESHAMLNSLAADMKRSPGMVIELSAHTDNLGSDEFNQKLSEARAQSCVDYLISQGIDASRIEVKGYGESMPIAPNQKANGKDNPEGRKKNRRTEFKVLHY